MDNLHENGMRLYKLAREFGVYMKTDIDIRVPS